MYYDAPIGIAPTTKMIIKPKSSELPESYTWQMPIQPDNLLSMSINKATVFIQIQYMMQIVILRTLHVELLQGDKTKKKHQYC